METLSIDKVVGETLAAMRGQLFQKGAGAKAVVSLQRAFALADIDGSGALDRYKQALHKCGHDCGLAHSPSLNLVCRCCPLLQ